MTSDSLPLLLVGGQAQIPERRCKRCGELKPLDEFEHKGYGRRRRICKSCANARARDDYATKPERREYLRNWDTQNPEKRKAYAQTTYERTRADLRRSIAKTLGTTRANCKRREIDISVVADDIVTLFHQQNGRCALTDREMIWGAKGVQRDTLSIDRIDQTQGYVLGNVRLVTYQANMARGPYSDEELDLFCEARLAAGNILRGESRTVPTMPKVQR